MFKGVKLFYEYFQIYLKLFYEYFQIYLKLFYTFKFI